MSRTGGQSYATCRGDFNSRRGAVSALKIGMTGFYNSSARTGTANVHITNVGNNAISGTLQCVVTETNIAYAWETEDSLFDVVRDMIPDQNGEAVVIPVGGSIDRVRDFSINAAWNASNCEVVVFVQNSLKEIYQAAIMPLTSVGVEENASRYVTLSNSGNPFTKGTAINYSVKDASRNVDIGIYDISGKLVKELVKGAYEPGNYGTYWDGRDGSGIKVSSGIYFCVLKSGNYKAVNKLVLTK